MQAIDYDVAILGAGPGGLSAAARAAERGMSHVLIEAAAKHANTIQQYQRRKHVMAEPSKLPLRSDMAFEAGRREDILAEWHASIERSSINVRYCAEVVKITKLDDVFSIEDQIARVIVVINHIVRMSPVAFAPVLVLFSRCLPQFSNNSAGRVERGPGLAFK